MCRRWPLARPCVDVAHRRRRPTAAPLTLPPVSLSSRSTVRPDALSRTILGGSPAQLLGARDADASPFLDAGDPRIVGHTARDAWIDDLPETEERMEHGGTEAGAPAPDAMQAALARLQARRADDVTASRVPATIASDDGVVEHVADVASWLATATERELRMLAADAWGGTEAVELAEALAADDPEVAEVVRHARRADCELVVEVDARAATAWLHQHRPDVADRLDDLLD
jgi:hypothetical protein